MANDLQTISSAPIAELTRLMSPLVSSALVGSSWQPEWGRRVFDREGVDVPALIAAHKAALRPASPDWLADRLNLLWKSSPVAGSLDATAWLHETTRLLCDIPREILADAIDEAVRKSERGFMPAIGEIRAIAEPRLSRLKLHHGRLKAIAALEPSKTLAPEDRCTPEQAKAIRDSIGLKIEEDTPLRAHSGPPTAPTREDYIRWGVDPDVLDGGADRESEAA